MNLLVWLRVPGDTVFTVGALALVVFVIGLWVFPRREDEQRERARGEDVRAASPGPGR